MARRRTIEVAKHAVFLLVTLVGAGTLIANLAWLGLWGIAGLVIAGAMLTVYALQRWGRGRPLHDAMGHTAVLLALGAACVLLLLVLLEGLRQRNFVTVSVVGLFLVTFVRILSEYVQVLRQRHRRGGMG